MSRAAIKALGEIGNPHVVESLIAALKKSTLNSALRIRDSNTKAMIMHSAFLHDGAICPHITENTFCIKDHSNLFLQLPYLMLLFRQLKLALAKYPQLQLSSTISLKRQAKKQPANQQFLLSIKYNMGDSLICYLVFKR